jgi:hypothetical protein
MQLSSLPIRCLLPALALMVATYARPQDVGTLTLLKDTPLRVIRGFSVLHGIEGMRLRQGDVLETGPSTTAQAQLEFSGGSIVELGPSSQIFLFSQTGTTAELIVLSGWLKGETASGTYRYANPLATATTKGGNVLLHVNEDSVDIFVERGAAAVSYGSQAPITSSTDKIFFTRRVGKPGVATDRPSPEFISSMPVCFRDNLPSRLPRFASNKPPELKSDHDVSYSDIERLLKLPPNWRKGFVERFKPRLQDPSFRQAIEAHITALPEWKPILYPDNHSSEATDKSDLRASGSIQ